MEATTKLTGSYLRIPKSAKVEVLFVKTDKWYAKVRYKGKVGHVNKKYLG